MHVLYAALAQSAEAAASLKVERGKTANEFGGQVRSPGNQGSNSSLLTEQQPAAPARAWSAAV